jgi:hypothetical protein
MSHDVFVLATLSQAYIYKMHPEYHPWSHDGKLSYGRNRKLHEWLSIIVEELVGE